jgi:hypothetical protein
MKDLLIAIILSYVWFCLILVFSGCGSIDHGKECWAQAGKAGAIAAWHAHHAEVDRDDLIPQYEATILLAPVYLVSQADARQMRNSSQNVRALNQGGEIYVCENWDMVDGSNHISTEAERVDRVVHESMHSAWELTSHLPNDWGGDNDSWFLATVEAGRVIAQDVYLRECK